MSSKPNQQQTIHVSWIVQLNSWFHLTNRKAMENYHSQAEILALDQNLQWFYFYISWFVQQNSGFDLNYRLSMKNYSLQMEIFTSGVLNHHWNLTKPYQTKPNQLKIEIWTENINLNNFYTWQLYDFEPYFRVTKLWVKTCLNPEFQNHSDMNWYLRSHFCSNFNLMQYFFQGFQSLSPSKPLSQTISCSM